ncbi:TPM domain-containing protein [Sphaerotilus hippei]|uniref:TPM domain-containing protein n=1 Tax=Sphaerotilus hippei TaxID=744406 RepID=UPI00287375C9|nr:TPM domain-containing protein [Sphaerotilus hippei]
MTIDETQAGAAVDAVETQTAEPPALPTRPSRWQRLKRLLRHQWSDPQDARRVLSSRALDRLQYAVHTSETGHSGEIRLCIEAGLPLADLWRDTTPRERAVTLFGELGVWDTEHNNGVLIYLLLADRAIEIVADRGLMRHVGTDEWAAITERMSESFAAARHEEGMEAAIAAVDALLRAYFPREPGSLDVNELPDVPVLI